MRDRPTCVIGVLRKVIKREKFSTKHSTTCNYIVNTDILDKGPPMFGQGSSLRITIIYFFTAHASRSRRSFSSPSIFVRFKNLPAQALNFFTNLQSKIGSTTLKFTSFLYITR